MRNLGFAQVLTFDSLQELPALLREIAAAVEALPESGQYPVAVSIESSFEDDEFGWGAILVVE